MKTKSNRPRLQIIRGLPGSGKTTLALKRYPHLLRLESDFFFYTRGAYRFSLPRNKEAVVWLFKAVKMSCDTESDFVVTGVFAAHTERLSTVIAIAKAKGYDIYIKTLKTDYGNVHGVPSSHYNAMKDAFVSDYALKKDFRSPQVHFGLMPKGTKLAPER